MVEKHVVEDMEEPLHNREETKHDAQKSLHSSVFETTFKRKERHPDPSGS